MVLVASWNVQKLTPKTAELVAAYLDEKAPDLLFLNETKCRVPKMEELLASSRARGYTLIGNPCARPQYHGTALLYKSDLAVELLDTKLPGSEHEAHCAEGRLIAVSLDGTAIVGTYVPNSGVGKNPLRRLDYRVGEWDRDMHAYLQHLDFSHGGGVLWIGDLNVAPAASDIYDIKGKARQAGFTKEERASHTHFLCASGFVDAWRAANPDEVKFSYWTLNRWHDLRPSGRGWRLDHTIVSRSLWKRVAAANIEDDVEGSDHCPVSITFAARELGAREESKDAEM